MEQLSKEYIIKKVEEHKDLIRDATDRLSDILFKNRNELSKHRELTEDASAEIRKVLHEIVTELSMIGGFCDKWTQSYIQETVNLIGRRTARRRIHYVDSLMLEWWAMRINGIIIDYNKTPFKLSDLKSMFSVLEKAFKSFGR